VSISTVIYSSWQTHLRIAACTSSLISSTGHSSITVSITSGVLNVNCIFMICGGSCLDNLFHDTVHRLSQRPHTANRLSLRHPVHQVPFPTNRNHVSSPLLLSRITSLCSAC